ncbi:MAG TPA: hypothetical protein VMS76_03545 [Planctomycetota bacterium]|nr:hypothetical protein [Planctomycetota bacterium]
METRVPRLERLRPEGSAAERRRAGYADHALRLERLLGWVLWTALAAALVWLSP